MLEKRFSEVYSWLRLDFFRGLLARASSRTDKLKADEAFMLEVISALGRPTIGQFAEFVQISRSDATYKINKLVGKGYLYKTKSEVDKREYYLTLTRKYHDYGAASEKNFAAVWRRLRQRFRKEEIDQFFKMMNALVLEMQNAPPEK